jgi:hypothetical protein
MFTVRTRCRVRTLFAATTLSLAAAALSGCSTMGTGTGSVWPTGAPVSFSWKGGPSGSTGSMSATVEGQSFTGPYLQVTHDVRTQDFYPMWAGWRRGWVDWYGWNGWYGPPYGPTVSYATIYSGRVLANLQAPDGERMRCSFFLNSPSQGMTGGGQGDCQLSNGHIVSAEFPPGSVVAGR